MSWSASARIAGGTDKSQANKIIDEIPVTLQSNAQADHVKAAKAAAKELLGGLEERIGMDYVVSISGHAAPAGWETIGATVSTTQTPEAAYAEGSAGK